MFDAGLAVSYQLKGMQRLKLWRYFEALVVSCLVNAKATKELLGPSCYCSDQTGHFTGHLTHVISLLLFVETSVAGHIPGMNSAITICFRVVGQQTGPKAERC